MKHLLSLTLMLGCLGLWMTVPSYADDFFAPAELEPSGIPSPPPWVQQPEEKETPPPGPPAGFWGDEDADDEPEPAMPSFGGFGSSSSSSTGKPKNSFQMVEPWTDPLQEKATGECFGWGHPFLGVNVYDGQAFCQFQLEQKIEISKQSIHALEDHTRGLILREAIKGNITRQQTKTVEFQYDQLLDTLIMARVSGCKCLQ